MRLKEIRIFGFKSFPKKVTLKLGTGVTALVGPNGCGKTNFVDAIRWALGEQRPTLLRCERMDELIFGGSEKKKPLGMAEVSLIFENDGGLPIDFSEVAVTRRLFRSGESEYLINNTPCRWKDITDLFLDTGLSAKAYALFERDMVDRILSTESGLRRAFFEEASGTAKYRDRRGLIFRKLDANKEDFARLLDLLAEVERQERSLKRQASKAKRYLELKKELDQKAVRSAFLRVQAWKREAGGLVEKMEERKRKVETLRREVLKLEEKIGERREAFKEKASTRSQTLAALKTLREEIRELDREIALTSERKKFLEERRNRTLEEKEGLRGHLPAFERALHEKKEKKEDSETQIELLQEKIKEKEMERTQLEENLKRIEEEVHKKKGEEDRLKRDLLTLEVKRDGLKDRLGELRKEERRWALEEEETKRVRVEKEGLLEEIHKRLEEVQGIREKIKKNLLEDQKALDERSQARWKMENRLTLYSTEMAIFKESKEMDEVLGTLKDVMTIQAGYDSAVEGALATRIGLLLVRNREEGVKVLETLREKGRLTLAPLDEFRTPNSDPELVSGRTPNSTLGLPNLLQFVTCEDRYRPLLETLFGKFLVVPDFPTALEMSHSQRGQSNESANGFHLVTPKGEVVEAEGFLRGGAFKPMDRDDEERCQKELEEIHRNIQHLKEEVQNHTLLLSASGGQLEGILREKITLEQECESLLGREEGIRNRIQGLKEEVERFEKEITSLEERMKEIEDLGMEGADFEMQNSEIPVPKADPMRKALEEAQNEVLQSRMELIRSEGEAEEWKRTVKRVERDLAETHSKLTKCDREAEDLEKVIRNLDQNFEEQQQHLDDSIERERRLVRVLEEMGEPTLFEAMEEEEMELKEKRESLSGLQEEMHQLKLRWTEIETQRKDLEEQVKRDFEAELENYTDEGGEIDPGEIEELRERIRNLEPVNMAAFEEHQEVEKRFEFLTTQKVDLEEGRKNLEASLKTLDREARTRFMDTFGKIRESFQSIFLRLFEGGKADLLLNGGGDPLHAEIEIMASPKGKRFQRIEHLSAGEKALTAIALLFALYFIKPAPFCILDEIDAPLDDANVERFTQLVREVSQRSQICLITHNKRTMGIADSLYGITMEEPGVTQIVSVKFQEGK
ncbi:chromosome segregation protein SMC [candidate division TA06 bacterium]|nr:chromosome segregation protein SMC [candidate division TA06 bacterium]